MLTKTGAKLWPVLGERNIFTVGYHLELKDEGVVVIDEDVTETYSDGQSLNPIKLSLKEKGQAKINKYKDEKALNAKPAYGTAISDVVGDLDTTE